VVEQSGIELEDVSFRIGDFAVRRFSLAVRQGEYFVLTGPNGAGKTVLLKLIAGLHMPDEGCIRVGGKRVDGVPPWKRNIGYVPQDGVLFPRRNVRQNIRFGLEVRPQGRDGMDDAVTEMAQVLGIEHLLRRMPAGLSGGERQKVSLARALIVRPAVLLLDEPVSAIDEDTRDALCRQLRRVQRRFNVTTIHVSHNRRETGLVADRVGVIEAGMLRGIEAALGAGD
jgi:ABC-type sugar transport system ATPase subunit